MSKPILILDFGSQYTQLIARRVRENNVFSSIAPFDISAEGVKKISPAGIIMSGGPAKAYGKSSPRADRDIYKMGIPILGICYGMQAIAQALGGKVTNTQRREYGSAELFVDDYKDLFLEIPANITCWMSHGDYIDKLPRGFSAIAHTFNTPLAAIADRRRKIYGLQFHPEVAHTQKGSQIISNFLFRVCKCHSNWQMSSFIGQALADIKKTVGRSKVVCGLSGGVDSSVTALLMHKAIGSRLRCIFIDNGLLRKNEPDYVRKTFRRQFKINLDCVCAKKRFLNKLKGVIDPEQKRKIVGNEFVNVFEEEAAKFKGVKFLAQGTLYPDVIESTPAFGGPTAKIKTHHNVGGLPLNMKLKLIEPLRELFKDEVRELGRQLGLPENIVMRQPFPGPGLSVRVIGVVTEKRLEILRQADDRLLTELKKSPVYSEIWQSFAVLLPVKTVGVMGDERSYENVVAIRCVVSSDGMTAGWARIPYDVLARISNKIINEVKGINRVTYDISSKPPATIEWE
ncbi:MAG: glutamine-hydrolyzing GMP synthase [Candidatus Omnitrophota bacterium]